MLCKGCKNEIKDGSKFCKHCGRNVEKDSEISFCTSCGKQIKNGSLFCKHCGAKIAEAAVICTHCGCQVEETPKVEQPNIVINNTNPNANTNINAAMLGIRERNKWIALALCFFLGFFGAHKFYEGKIGLGILYIFTGGLFGIGVIIDFIVLLCKPVTYYVR